MEDIAKVRLDIASALAGLDMVRIIFHKNAYPLNPYPELKSFESISISISFWEINSTMFQQIHRYRS